MFLGPRWFASLSLNWRWVVGGVVERVLASVVVVVVAVEFVGWVEFVGCVGCGLGCGVNKSEKLRMNLSGS